MSETTGESHLNNSTVDLISPLVQPDHAGPSRWTTKQVRAVKAELQKAVKRNKTHNHTLVAAHFADISTHVRTARHLQSEELRISRAISGLEDQIEEGDPDVAFLPPVLSSLSDHFQRVNRRDRAKAHREVAGAIKTVVDRVRTLEEAVWSGRGIQHQILDDLLGHGSRVGNGSVGNGDEGDRSLLRGTSLDGQVETKIEALQRIVLLQAEEAFHDCVAITSGDDAAIRVQRNTVLADPQSPRPKLYPRPNKSSLPAYTYSQILSALQRLGVLEAQLDRATKHITEILLPALLQRRTITQESQDATDRLAVGATEGEEASLDSSLESLSAMLSFIGIILLPDSLSDDLEDANLIAYKRKDLLNHITKSFLETLIIPSTPQSIDKVPVWLSTLSVAAEIEQQLTASTHLADFFSQKAGTTFAEHKAQEVFENVKNLVLGGWRGWEAMEVSKDRERRQFVLVQEEVAELQHDESAAVRPNNVTTAVDEAVASGPIEEGEGDAWGFDEPLSPSKEAAKSPAGVSEVDEGNVDEAWGFDGSTSPVTTTAQPTAALQEGDEDEGWDFELSGSRASAPTQIAPAITAPKPKAREAKKLGKKIGKSKAKAAAEGAGSDFEPDVHERVSVSHRQVSPSPITAASFKPDATDDGWGWDDEPTHAVSPPKPVNSPPPRPSKQSRTVVKEVTVCVTDTYLVSKACQDLVNLVKTSLDEAASLSTSRYGSNPLPSQFAESSYHLVTAASSALTLFRALIFASPHVDDVPTLGMQLSNDCAWIADHLPIDPPSSTADELSETEHNVEAGSAHVEWDREAAVELMRNASAHAYERQLAVQREGLQKIVDDLPVLGDVGDDVAYKRALRSIEEIKATLDSLGRVWKLVLPEPQYLDALGHLIDMVLSSLITSTLSLLDIPQLESERLVEIFTILKPLENLGVLDQSGAESGRPSNQEDQDQEVPVSTIAAHAPHWLKFVYMINLLGANLKEIGEYLDHGALVDFEREELVRLIRALFAESENREALVNRIEGGR